MEGDQRGVAALEAGRKNFYPRPHMEGDEIKEAERKMNMHFYPRPHMEGDLSSHKSPPARLYFYPRPHMEGDLKH